VNSEDWNEEEYVQFLMSERRSFAWVLQRHGRLSDTQAEAAALERYPYEADDEPFRGLIFHDESWHWAMLWIYGDAYTVDRPELVQPSAEYRALD
jgi:hypothetical protein